MKFQAAVLEDRLGFLEKIIHHPLPWARSRQVSLGIASRVGETLAISHLVQSQTFFVRAQEGL